MLMVEESCVSETGWAGTPIPALMVSEKEPPWASSMDSIYNSATSQLLQTLVEPEII